MIKLEPMSNTEFSEYVVKLLHKHDICTVRDFRDADVSKLSKIMNLNECTVENLKEEILRHHGPKIYTLGTLLNYSKFEIYGTGIKRLGV